MARIGEGRVWRREGSLGPAGSGVTLRAQRRSLLLGAHRGPG